MILSHSRHQISAQCCGKGRVLVCNASKNSTGRYYVTIDQYPPSLPSPRCALKTARLFMSTMLITDESAVPLFAISARLSSSGSSSCINTGGMRCRASFRRYLRSSKMLSLHCLLINVVATPVLPQRPVLHRNSGFLSMLQIFGPWGDAASVRFGCGIFSLTF